MYKFLILRSRIIFVPTNEISNSIDEHSYFYEYGKLKYAHLNRIFALLLFCNDKFISNLLIIFKILQLIQNVTFNILWWLILILYFYIQLISTVINILHKYGLGSRWFDWHKDYYENDKYLEQGLMHNNIEGEKNKNINAIDYKTILPQSLELKW